MTTLNERRARTSLVVHDWSECLRLVGRASRASVELHRHRLPAPLDARYRMDGHDVVLSLDTRKATALAHSDLSLSILVEDPRTAATWRVVLFGTADKTDAALRVRPASMVAYRVLEHSSTAECA